MVTNRNGNARPILMRPAVLDVTSSLPTASPDRRTLYLLTWARQRMGGRTVGVDAQPLRLDVLDDGGLYGGRSRTTIHGGATTNFGQVALPMSIRGICLHVFRDSRRALQRGALARVRRDSVLIVDRIRNIGTARRGADLDRCGGGCSPRRRVGELSVGMERPTSTAGGLPRTLTKCGGRIVIREAAGAYRAVERADRDGQRADDCPSLYGTFCTLGRQRAGMAKFIYFIMGPQWGRSLNVAG